MCIKDFQSMKAIDFFSINVPACMCMKYLPAPILQLCETVHLIVSPHQYNVQFPSWEYHWQMSQLCDQFLKV